MILALKSFSNSKSPGKSGLTKELYGTFWEELKPPFMNLLNQAKVSITKASSNKIIRKEGQR